MSNQQSQPRIVIIGAGTAGIMCAIALKNQLHFENFRIYEKSSTIGGTWSQNTYPGCGSDLPIHWYSFSSELNSYWSTHFATQPEILAYWERIVQKHDLEKFTTFNTIVTSLEWNEERQLYCISLEDVITGGSQETTAEIVISAVGIFRDPTVPSNIPDTDKFKGLSWHSARWRHDVNLSGKRVGVIGNGCSASQIIPEISRDPTVEVINFARSPQWYIPKLQYSYPEWVKWTFAHVPFAMRMHRYHIMASREFRFAAFRSPDSQRSQYNRKLFTAYIKKNAPPEHVDRLLPNFAPGCKRLIVDPGYLRALKQQNVNLRWDKIDRVAEEGIQLGTGEIVPLDVIIYATGFSIYKGSQLRVKGRNGQTLEKYWDEQGGPTAYLATCVPDIPNYFIIAGPNAGTGHASIIFASEVQVQYIIQLIKPILDTKVQSLAVKAEPTMKYNNWLQERLQRSVWGTCVSWYRDNQAQGKNVGIFPGMFTHLWWLLRRPLWGDFSFEGSSVREWERGLQRAKMAKKLLALVVTTLVLLGCGIWRRSPRSRQNILDQTRKLVGALASLLAGSRSQDMIKIKRVQ